MSKIHEELRKKPDSKWFVRISNGSVYGPVELIELQGWAAQGRIEPDNEISEDQENWQPAESLPELEINWIAELGDGEVYGPFNIHLAPELVASGVLPSDAIITHRHTGETKSMDSSTEASIPEEAEAPEKKIAPNRKATSAKPKTTEEQASNELTESTEREDDEEDSAPITEPEQDIAEIEIEEELPPAKKPAASPPTPAPAEDDSTELVSRRLETLQQSASQARSQLATTRKQLTEQRAMATAMQDQIRKLQDDVRSAETEKADSDQRLLEQQDKLASALSDVENLNAQLEQLKDHYDRLQIESQNQFEALDRLRSESMQKEQEYKHNIGREQDRASEKTSRLAKALQLIVQDEDIEHGKLPKELLSTSDEGLAHELQSRVIQLQQQTDLERQHSRELEHKLTSNQADRARNLLLILLLIVVVGLTAAIVIILKFQQDIITAKRSARPPATKIVKSKEVEAPTHPQPQGETSALAGLIVTNNEPIKPPAAILEPNHNETDLDLLPEERSKAVLTPEQTAPVNWPQLNIPGSVISSDAMSHRITFTYGVFSSSTQISKEARKDLLLLAKQLRGLHQGFTLLVEGHTDATPINSLGSRYVDNFALGMARAEAVKTYLEVECGLPGEFIKTASAGPDDPPHSNSTEASRRKNRTVVLTLTPR